jgi:transposase
VGTAGAAAALDQAAAGRPVDRPPHRDQRKLFPNPRRSQAWLGRGRPPAFDPERSKERNTVERCVNKLKNFRAVATGYDKRELIYQGTIDVASIRIWLRDPMK